MAAIPTPLFLLPRQTPLHVIPRLRPPHFPRHVSTRRLAAVAGGGDGGEFTTTRRSPCELSALATVLVSIKPLDTSVIGPAVSGAARDSMKRTISTMLGLLPSHQFDVSITISKHPLRHLLVSSVVTGYALWNVEYRVSLTRKFERFTESLGEDEDEVGCSVEEMDGEGIGELPMVAERYVRELEERLALVEKELDNQKHKYIHLELDKEEDNDLLKYLRSIEPVMVSELSQPSSPEVEEIVEQLVQGIQLRYFSDDFPNFSQDESLGCEKDVNSHDASIVATRDSLAKLLFWCMLLGHHLRSLEHRLHMNCVDLL